jgi:hypothetical protein
MYNPSFVLGLVWILNLRVLIAGYTIRWRDSKD